MCRIEYADVTTFSKVEERTARKSYRCDECGEPIEKGDRYEYAFGVVDTHALVTRTCVLCFEPRAWLVAECGGYILTEVLDELVEHWQENDELRTWRLARLIATMRRRSRRNRPVKVAA